MISTNDESLQIARSHAKIATFSDRLLPDMVFTKRWHKYFFFESDFFFSDKFIEFLVHIRDFSRFNIVCLLNLSREGASPESEIYVNPEDKAERYRALLEEGGPSKGWIYDMEQYACASDSPDWVIYFERWNDIGVIAVESSDESQAIINIIENYGGVHILEVSDASSTSIFGAPLGKFRISLMKNYS